MANITPEEARERAVRAARLAAIESECGVAIGAESLIKDFVLSGDFIHSVSYGQVVADTVVREDVVVARKAWNCPPELTYVVELKVKVQCESGRPDPAFRVSVKPNKRTFLDGEELVLSVSATHDCYLTVVNFDAENRALVLMPSGVMAENFVAAGTIKEIPSVAQRAAGVCLRMGLPEGRRQSSEAILVVATKRKVEFFGEVRRDQGFGVLPNLAVAGTEMAKWLVNIPMAERAQDQVVIEVRRQ